MKSKIFQLKGIQEPGKVHVFKHGTIELANSTDEILDQIWKRGCLHLELTPEGRKKYYPDEKPIEVKKINIEKESTQENKEDKKYGVPKMENPTPPPPKTEIKINSKFQAKNKHGKK